MLLQLLLQCLSLALQQARALQLAPLQPSLMLALALVELLACCACRLAPRLPLLTANRALMLSARRCCCLPCPSRRSACRMMKNSPHSA